MQLEPGLVIGGGRFRLIRPVGAGGMACVWAAHHEILDRDVAIKLTRADGDTSVSRFLREAQIVGRFDHPNIVGVLDAGALVEEGYVFLVMELLRGATLAERLVPGVPLDPAEIVPILVDVCRGLEVAHAAGVVHRDIKPENVFLAEGPEGTTTKLMDFGISRLVSAASSASIPPPRASDAGDASALGGARAVPLTIDGQLLGTPAYMSPEQAQGIAAVDARVDVWAVGVVLYEALAGAQPFVAANHYALLRAIVDGAPAPLPASVPAELRAIVARCLEKSPARRFASASELRAALESASLGRAHAASAIVVEPAGAPPSAGRLSRTLAQTVPSSGPRLLLGATPRRRHGARALTVAAVAAFSVAIAGFSASPGDAPERLASGVGASARRCAAAARGDGPGDDTPVGVATPSAVAERSDVAEAEPIRCEPPSRPLHRQVRVERTDRTRVTSPGF